MHKQKSKTATHTTAAALPRRKPVADLSLVSQSSPALQHKRQVTQSSAGGPFAEGASDSMVPEVSTMTGSSTDMGAELQPSASLLALQSAILNLDAHESSPRSKEYLTMEDVYKELNIDTTLSDSAGVKSPDTSLNVLFTSAELRAIMPGTWAAACPCEQNPSLALSAGFEHIGAPIRDTNKIIHGHSFVLSLGDEEVRKVLWHFAILKTYYLDSIIRIQIPLRWCDYVTSQPVGGTTCGREVRGVYVVVSRREEPNPYLAQLSGSDMLVGPGGVGIYVFRTLATAIAVGKKQASQYLQPGNTIAEGCDDKALLPCVFFGRAFVVAAEMASATSHYFFVTDPKRVLIEYACFFQPCQFGELECN
jgi:hypothetical protein